jgi:hypothetical protein
MIITEIGKIINVTGPLSYSFDMKEQEISGRDTNNNSPTFILIPLVLYKMVTE